MPDRYAYLKMGDVDNAMPWDKKSMQRHIKFGENQHLIRQIANSKQRVILNFN
jgi:hypothetical protein